MKQFLLRRGRGVIAAVMSATMVVVGLVALPILATPAYAVTGTTGPINVTATPTTNLASGATIAINGVATSGTISDVQVKVCDAATIGTVNSFKFTSGVYCPESPSGTFTNGNPNNFVQQVQGLGVTNTNVNFLAGTGTVSWNANFDASPHTLTCNSANPTACVLVIQYGSSVAPNNFYFKTPLTYAAPLAVPGAPVLSSATPGDTIINAAWTAPASTGNGTIDQYTVTATRTGGTADPLSPHVVVVSGTTLSTTIPGLVNGAIYDVSVVARNTDGQIPPAHFSSVASNIISATPFVNATIGSQPIDVTRPQGALILTQACVNPDPYPLDPITGIVFQPASVCPQSVALGTATFITSGPGAGQFFKASGPMNPVTIVDTRSDTDPGWTASASVSNFTADAPSTGSFSGGDLGIVPSVIDRTGTFTTPDQTYSMRVIEGAVVNPVSDGLATPKTLANAGLKIPEVHPPFTGGLGISHIGGTLNLLIPIFARSGHYRAVLTITAA